MNPRIEFNLRLRLGERIVTRLELDRSVFPGRGARWGDRRRACRLADVLAIRPDRQCVGSEASIRSARTSALALITDIQQQTANVGCGSVAVSRTSESERRRWPNPSSHHRVLADQGPQSTGLRTDAPFRPTAIPPRRPLRGLRRRAARTLTLSPPLMPTRTAADRTSACFSAPKIPWQWPLDYRNHADAATESSVTKTHIFNAI